MHSSKYQFILIFFLWLMPLFACAGDLSMDVRNAAAAPDYKNGGFFEFGGGGAVFTSPFYGIPEGNEKGEIHSQPLVTINSRWQYNRWFVEIFSEGLEGTTLGYHLHSDGVWAFDLVGLQEHGSTSKDISGDFKNVEKRSGDFMVGARASAYFGKSILEFHALTDGSDLHNGQMFSAKMARHLQYKNWNFHAIIGTSYRTENLTDYYFSAKPGDIYARDPSFHAAAGFTQVVEVGATYPMSQKWVLRTFFRHLELDKKWEKSPLLVDNRSDMIFFSINYVLQP